MEEEFDPTQMYHYTVSQMADFIISGEPTKDELYAMGYPAAKRQELEEELTRRARLPQEDDEMWEWAQRNDTVAAYKKYLERYDVYGDGVYRGKYVFDARARMDELIQEGARLKDELFETMKVSPWLFNSTVVQYLINGVNDQHTLEQSRGQTDITSRFISTGQRITFQEIRDHGIVPNDWTLEKITAPDSALPQTNIRELGNFPTDSRTDIYFLGVPRGGKSSVLAGIFYQMFRQGQVSYESQLNAEGIDKCLPYYNGLIESVDAAKFPVSTATDSISFMKVKLRNNQRENALTFVEIAGEAFRTLAKANMTGRDVWNALGAAQCIKSNNRKLLFFIVDYSIARGDVRSDQEWTDLRQARVLEDALRVLKEDGTGPQNTVGCTLSKVDTVAVIVTKSDLMGENLTPQQRNDVALNYLTTEFKTFMNNLSDSCRAHGINAPIGYNPYILTFSLGKLLIGNTYDYDPSDSCNIIDFISSVTTTRSNRKWGKSIFG